MVEQLVEMREKDREMKNLMIKYWTNFAKFGHPTPASSDNTTQWLPYGEQKNYMVIDSEPKMSTNLENERMVFWQKIHWNEREAKIREDGMLTKAFRSVSNMFTRRH
jgi:carboxylesterase type B